MRKELNTIKSTYEKVVASNIMYVDKTDYLYKLVSVTDGQFFLSRPRRFGKSMTLSTLKAIFEGKKESFKGQYIYDKPFDWKSYPIIHLSMNKIKADTAKNFEENLAGAVDKIAKQYSITLKAKDSSIKFEDLILALSKDKNDVVILIDEYDKAILDNVLESEKCNEIRKILKSFYGQIKANEDKIRFAFITGVSKFTQVSIFSDMNNLEDITMDKKFAGICGFTQEECNKYFAEWIAENAEELNMTKDAYLAKLKVMYNGIRFSEKPLSLYNPVSFTNAMENCDFRNYWAMTGTPTFLLNLMQKYKYDIRNLDGIEVKENSFASYEIDKLKIAALLYQTGYLTIKGYNPKTKEFTLAYPNQEVRETFTDTLSSDYLIIGDEDISRLLKKLTTAIENNDIENFIEVIKIYLANIDYDLKIKHEKWYQTVFYLIFISLNYRIDTEVKTNKGRIDAVIETEKYLYIFEFKLDQSAEVAIEQIKEKEYYQKYLLSEKELVLVGVNFDSKTGNVSEWKKK